MLKSQKEVVYMEEFTVMKKPIPVKAYQTDKKVEIKTLEGTMTADAGDWIITGVKGEQWPVRKDIFEETYKKIQNQL